MQDKAPLQIQDLVLKTLGQNKLSGLSEMLKLIVNNVGAFGCILWQVAPDSVLDKKAPKGHMFVLAQWFSNNKMDVLHDLQIERSVTGNAILNNKFRRVVKRKSTEQWFIDDKFLIDNKIESFCSMPIEFPDIKTKGAVNLYRNTKKPFDEHEREQVKLLALLVPSLYGAIRDKVSHKLIRRVNEIFEEEFRAANGHSGSDKDKVKKVLLKVCDIVTDSFQCIETSIFLEDSLKAPGEYDLMETTWPLPEHFNKTTYKKGDNGLTGWVLSHARNVKIFDLEYFDRDKEAIRSKYPGLTWVDSLNTKEDKVKSAIRKKLEIMPEDRLPPFSFMAVPIVKGKEVQGVIRCSIAAKGPYYFADHELELLELVAAQISRYWSHREEITAWRALTMGIGEMNDFVYKELTKDKPEESRIFKKALQVISPVIKGADVMNVHRNYGTTPDLDFVKFDTKRRIVAPISIKDEVYGELDIRVKGKSPFPSRAGVMADLVGRQLGLYLYLQTIVGELRTTQADLKDKNIGLEKVQAQQIQAFQDLWHQLQSPMLPALTRIQLLLKQAPAKSKLESDLLAIRGLFRKVRRVSMSLKLFVELARKETIQAKTSPVQPKDLIQMLIEGARDNQLMTDPHRDIRFNVDKLSLETFRATYIEINLDLLAQAVMNILDNARKYSFDKTEIRIYGGLTKTGRFHLTVSNTGLPIRPEEVTQCIERHWRGGRAELTVGEGSGIGLWIVHNIMKGHKGDLVIIPTEEHITEVKLVFPISK